MSLISGASNLTRGDLCSGDGSVSPLSFRSDLGAAGGFIAAAAGPELSASPRRTAASGAGANRQDSQIFQISTTSSMLSLGAASAETAAEDLIPVPPSAVPGEIISDFPAEGLTWSKAGGDELEPLAAATPPSASRVTRAAEAAAGRGTAAASEAAGVVREAMSPSVAESIRAVFAAFVWHSGIVQDTLACAAFLKFNSGLTKQGSGGSSSEGFGGGTRQQKSTDVPPTARQRHSVEVISTTYLNYKENDWVDRQSGGNANRNVILNNGGAVGGSWDFREAAGGGGGALLQHTIPEHEECEGELRSRRGVSAPAAVPGLPPTLAQLVALWEGTVLNCLDAILAHSCGPPPPPPAVPWSKGGGGGRVAAYKNLKNNREATSGGPAVSAAGAASLFSCALQQQQQNSGNPVIERPRDGGSKDGQPHQGGGVCDNWLCDICGGYFEPPVTYHMRAAHPGCGAHAGGKGYNSGGQYCGGWAGNCGDGGIGGSSWYLICERCKERHRRKYQTAAVRSGGGGEGPSQRFNPVSLSAMLASFSYASATSPVGPLDCHAVMKANSMFLLDLASSGGDQGDAASRRQLAATELETVSELAAGTGVLGSWQYSTYSYLYLLSSFSYLDRAIRIWIQAGKKNLKCWMIYGGLEASFES